MTRTRRLLLPLVVIALSGLVAACGGDGDNAAAENDTPSELTVYSGRDEELVKPLLDKFSEETGIKLNVRYAETAELAATIIEEGDASPADVFFGQDAGALGALQKDGRFIDLPDGTLHRVDERFRSSEGKWVGTSGRARVIVYDKREHSASDVPRSLFDLTDAKWKGKVGWAPMNASFQAAVTAMRKLSGDEATERWLREMKANGTKSFDGNSAIRDAVNNRELELGLINHYYVLQAVAESGDDDYPVGIAFTAPKDPGSLVNVAGGGVLTTSDAPAGGVRLLDFLLDEESQRYFLEETQEYPLVEGLPGPKGVPPLADIDQPDIDLSDLDDLMGTLALIEKAGIL